MVEGWIAVVVEGWIDRCVLITTVVDWVTCGVLALVVAVEDGGNCGTVEQFRPSSTSGHAH